jgi:transposase
MSSRTRRCCITLYEQLSGRWLGLPSLGISRATLRKWWRRYQAEGIAGLEEHSRRPRRAAGRKIFEEQEALILEVRRTRQLGIKQLRNELLRDHGLRLSLDTLHRVLAKNGENRLKRPRLARKGTKRYSRPVPGDRVQMDVCKIASALYQYTAIDDCLRWKVLGLYPRRSAASTLGFLERLLEEMPFPIQRLQTDRRLEFFADAVQGWGIKFPFQATLTASQRQG